MSKHDYTVGAVQNIDAALTNMQSRVENAAFSISSMSYSWDAGVIHNVVTFVEVLKIGAEKDYLAKLFQLGGRFFGKAASGMVNCDNSFATKIATPNETLTNIITSLNALLETARQYGQVQESHVWMDERQAEIYAIKKYVTYDKEKGEYVYNWDEISKIFKKGENSKCEDYDNLCKILQTFLYDDGSINTEALSAFLELGCTDGLPLTSNNSTIEYRDGYVLKMLAGMMQLRNTAIATVNKDYLALRDLSELSVEEKTSLKKIRSEMALGSIIIAVGQSYSDINFNSASRYVAVGSINTSEHLGLGSHLSGILVKENEELERIVDFDIKYNNEVGSYNIATNKRNFCDVYIHTPYPLDMIKDINTKRAEIYGDKIEKAKVRYTKETTSIGEYTEEFIEKKSCRKRRRYCCRCGEICFGPNPNCWYCC